MKHGRHTKPKFAQEKRRGPGRPAIWKAPILALKTKNQFIPARNKSEAMTIYICGRRCKPPVRVRVQKQPDGTYRCFKK